MSTTGIETTLRTQLLGHVSLTDEQTLADVLGRQATGNGSDGVLFWDVAPDNITKTIPRWGVLRLQNRRADGSDGQDAETAELEVMLFGRGRQFKATIERCADMCDEAMLRFDDRTTDLVHCWNRLRSTLPPFSAPADTEVVQIRTVYSLRLYPENLTQYSDTQ